MNVPDLASGLQRELKRRKYFVSLEILDQTLNIIKAHLYISNDGLNIFGEALKDVVG
ncbi:MAG: hypothetical protein NTW69_17820 [Chloroflexi bacterium]|nr:hypothetical protein [Chloroflexota bacterium]